VGAFAYERLLTGGGLSTAFERFSSLLALSLRDAN
jgi:hypothetical protein